MNFSHLAYWWPVRKVAYSGGVISSTSHFVSFLTLVRLVGGFFPADTRYTHGERSVGRVSPNRMLPPTSLPYLSPLLWVREGKGENLRLAALLASVSAEMEKGGHPDSLQFQSSPRVLK